MSDQFYPRGARALQDRFDERRLADRLEQRIVRHALTDDDRGFIQRLDMFFLATVDEEGRPSCSYKGGAPGFVRAVDDRTLAFPSYDGNGMFLSLGNITTTRQVGMLFIDFIGQSRLRVTGDASIDFGDPLLAEYPEADVVVRVGVRDVFPNCGRYIHKMQLVERSRFVPREGVDTPTPKWKHDLAKDVLPAGDPANDPKREIISR
jgi:predicted pyridoxine 5'-phosphate oxidase superfamily flavin-nucleotide-binding protein